jgi:hypothetical protein
MSYANARRILGAPREASRDAAVTLARPSCSEARSRTIRRTRHGINPFFTFFPLADEDAFMPTAPLASARCRSQLTKETACGFRNRQHCKLAIYFHCGHLDLYLAMVTA